MKEGTFMTETTLNNEASQKLKAILECKIFLFINISKNTIRLSENNTKEVNEILYSEHASFWSMKSIANVIKSMNSSEVILPDEYSICADSINIQRPLKYNEKLMYLEFPYAKKYIFAVKKYPKVSFANFVLKQQYLCLIKTDEAKIVFNVYHNKDKVYGDVVMAFTDSDSIRQYIDSLTDEEKKCINEYQPLIMQAKSIIKYAKKYNCKGVLCNPKNIPIHNKNFSFFVSSELPEYIERQKMKGRNK